MTKHTALSLVLLLTLAAGCKRKDDNPATCTTASSFTVTQHLDELDFQIINSGTAQSYEVAYDPAGANPVPGNSRFFLFKATDAKQIADLALASGQSYTFFVRPVCSNGAAEWTGPMTLLVGDYCGRPKNLRVTNPAPDFVLEWNNPAATTASSYQVQYGLDGFALGTGTTGTVTNPFFDEPNLAAHKTYDFYVRSFCNSSAGWSEWAGPLKYFSASDQNRCNTPSHLQYSVVRNGAGQAVGANFQWDLNGEDDFEYTYVLKGQSVTNGSINRYTPATWPTLMVTQSTDYDFYVRTVCKDGNRTAWAGPLAFNIGQ